VNASTPERRAFHEFVERHRSFLLTSHVNPDGDSLGSEVALALWLRARGKDVRVINDSAVPSAFTFLARHVPLEVFDPELAEQLLEAAEALIVLDVSNRQRIGRLAPLLDRHLVPIAVIDHHASHTRGFGQVSVIEPEASATGEIVYDLIRESGGTLDPALAEALYVALMTDTGSFRYSNTDSPAHRMAADLLSHGLDPERLHAQVHSHASAARMRFFGEVLAALELVEDDRVVVLEASPEQFQRHGLTGSDTETLVDMPRTIAGVEAVVLFSEVEPGKVKVSLRSTGRIVLDGLAAALGGGGHPHAAGATVHGTRAEARARVMPELHRLLAADPVSPGVPDPASPGAPGDARS